MSNSIRRLCGKITIFYFIMAFLFSSTNITYASTVQMDEDEGTLKGNIILSESVEEAGMLVMPMMNGMAASTSSGANKVLIIQSVYPWDSSANQQVLTGLGIEYTQVHSSQLGSIDLSEYRVVIIPNDQDDNFYATYRQNKTKIEDFIKSGGTMVFGASSGGWSGGNISSSLPGNILIRERYMSPQNYISDYTHPIVTAELSNGQPLTDGDLYSNYCSHTNFIESSLPAGTKIILRSSSNGEPTLIEYPFGNGIVIATGLTWEHSWMYHTGGDVFGTFGRKALDDVFLHVFSYNKPPVMSVDVPTANQAIGINSIVYPMIHVSDVNGNTLTCNYYIDNESVPRDTVTVSNTKTAQAVSFKILDISNLSQGIHTIKFEVDDAFAAPVQETVTFIVDRQPPILGAVTFTPVNNGRTIAIAGSATDNLSGLDTNPYRYIVGDFVSPWTFNPIMTINSLLPNTYYTAIFEAKDRSGNIATSMRYLYTYALVPSISVSNLSETSADISFSEGNPQGTRYTIYANDNPVTSWIEPVNGRITVDGLSPNTLYHFQAKAINGDGLETALSASASKTTLSGAPVNVAFDLSQTEIAITWDAIDGALGYDIELDGSIITSGLTSNTYTCTGLGTDTGHRIRIRTTNATGTGSWSGYYDARTLPYPPETPTGFQAIDIANRFLTLAWDWVVGAAGYQIEVNGSPIVNVDGTTASQYTFENINPDTEYTYRLAATNRGGPSPWSEAVSVRTLPDPPAVPGNLRATATITTVTFTWNAAAWAESYRIMVDGVILDNGNSTAFTHEGLNPVSRHTYKVKAINRGFESDWSEEIQITTLPEKPVTPSNILMTSDREAINLTWYKVPYAERYEVELDGSRIESTGTEGYTHAGLSAGTQHTYRIRAVNISGVSSWSKEISMETLPEVAQTEDTEDTEKTEIVVTNVTAVVTNTSILLSWDAAAYEGQYDIEVDGVILDNGADTDYSHTDLLPETYHTYKIRVRDNRGLNEWCTILSLCTLPNPPQAPVNLEAVAGNDRIELSWERAEGAEEYDLEIDGGQVVSTSNEGYIHEGLTPGTSHTYRIRAKNITGVTVWGPAITQSTTSPTYIAGCVSGKAFDLSVLAENVQEFMGMKFVILYDKEALEVVDLYKGTPLKDTTDGNIPGTAVSVRHTPGQIEFTVNESVLPGTSWSGEISAITFMPKITGTTGMDVQIGY